MRSFNSTKGIYQYQLVQDSCPSTPGSVPVFIAETNDMLAPTPKMLRCWAPFVRMKLNIGTRIHSDDFLLPSPSWMKKVIQWYIMIQHVPHCTSIKQTFCTCKNDGWKCSKFPFWGLASFRVFSLLVSWGVYTWKTLLVDIWYIYMGVSKSRGTWKWMVYNGKPLLKFMIWGYPLFLETSIIHI